MAKSTMSVSQVFELYPTAEAAREYLESRRWPNGPVCPHCEHGDQITKRGGDRTGYYRCRDCGSEFTVRSRSILERSRVPLNKWLYAIYLVGSAPNGMSSLKLSEEIGVQQKTAWFMLQRLRDALGDRGQLDGLESASRVLRPSIDGATQYVSFKHLARQIHEARLPHNFANVKQSTLGRLAAFAAKAYATMSRYRELTT